MLSEVDDFVTAGYAASRSAAINAAVEEWLKISRRRKIDEMIVAGYDRIPPALPDRALVRSAAGTLRELEW